MHSVPKLVRSTLALFALVGCSGKNVLQNANIERASMRQLCPGVGAVDFSAQDAMRVYLDRDGSLYSGPAIPVLLDSEAFHGPTEPLRDYFSRAREAPVWRSLADSLNVDVGSDDAWPRMQEGIRTRIAQNLDRMTMRPDGSRRPVVVLVHGFNVDDPECTYAAVRSKVEPIVPDALYLQIGWDGLVTNSPIPAIWGGAQFNFPLVGMGIRRLFKAIAERDAGMPVRILTHSSGGPVIAHALWDASPAEGASTKASHWRAFQELVAMRRDHRVPSPPNFEDLRLGMIVPATSGLIVEKYDRGSDGPELIVIGMNRKDMAVSKPIVGCSVKGETCLAVRAEVACSVRHQFADNPHTNVMLFDFSASTGYNESWFRFWEAHDWEVYMKRDDIDRFLRALLTDEAVEDEAGEICRDAGTRP